MKLGGHAYAWKGHWSNETLYIIDSCKKIGLDFLEIPLIDFDQFDAKAVNDRREGLEITTSTMLWPDMDVTSPDPAMRKNGVESLKKMVRASAEVGAKLMSGVIFVAARKPMKRPATEQEWAWSTTALKEVAKYAQDFGLTIGIEATHRYTNYLINTAEQCRKYVDMVGEPNVICHLDICHMCIEEKDFYKAIITAGDKLGYFHLQGSDRGVPGQDFIDWDAVFSAFKVIGYNGRIGFEGFTTEYPFIWRQVIPGDDGDYLARESLKFTAKMMDKYQIKRG
ncbi:MAG: sugar phosphate isomerase/epimerase family protein [Christensenellales bacterium]